MKYVPHPYQNFADNHATTHPFCGLFLRMGLGKTVVTSTVTNRLIYEDFEVSKCLIIAPLRVAVDTWPSEFAKWDHLKHLRVSVIAGKDPAARTRAIKQKADIYVINRENISWLVNFYKTGWPYDMVVVDESSSFKDSSSQRFKSLRIVRPFMQRVILLTGTPMPNGLEDIWSQVYLLDQGQRLGKNITSFREVYMVKKPNGFGYKPRPGAMEEVQKLISDICISMDTKDYLQLPGMVEHTIEVKLDEATQKKYDDFEEDQIMQLANEKEITALSAGALVGKLLQFSNGAVYDKERGVHHMHDLKLDALAELIEQAGSEQVLIAYQFQHDRERILKRFPKARLLDGRKDIEDWNNRKVGIMVTHAASAGHGLNLQAGGKYVIWFGCTWSRELYEQFNARLDRQGQTELVTVYRIICESTMDTEQLETIARKGDAQESLMKAVKARIEYYQKRV